LKEFLIKRATINPDAYSYHVMNELTQDEMRDMINIAITKAYPKMLLDEKRITSYNYSVFSDLLSFCMEQFLTKKSIDYQFKLCVTDNKIANYMGRSMSLNLRSSGSPYWHKIRQHSYNYRGLYLAETDRDYVNGSYDEIKMDEMDNYDCMLQALNKLDFYHKPLISDYYLNGMTYVQMNKKYHITLHSLKQAIDKGLELMRQHCNKFI
jgi:hypothetical protein